MSRRGLLVMAYGTPQSLDEVASYYTHIRRGRPPTADQLRNLLDRYAAIGGVSPLTERTEAQRIALQKALNERDGSAWTVALSHKHSAPFIEDGVRFLVEDGVDVVVGLVLAPHFSVASVGQYHDRAIASVPANDVPYCRIDSWHLLPAYLDFLAAAVSDARSMLPERHKIVFTAHSLPESAMHGDPYAEQLHQSARAVANRAGLARWTDWALGWQSAGRTSEPWRGPDIRDIIERLGATRKTEGVLVCAQGFTSDHLEVLYDLDIEAAQVAREAGLGFARTRSLNDDPDVMGALADRVLQEVGHDGPASHT